MDSLSKFGITVVFSELLKLASDKKVWIRLVKIGAEKCFEDWGIAKDLESMDNHRMAMIKSRGPDQEQPSAKEVKDSWEERKRGPFWKIEGKQESNITVKRKREVLDPNQLILLEVEELEERRNDERVVEKENKILYSRVHRELLRLEKERSKEDS